MSLTIVYNRFSFFIGKLLLYREVENFNILKKERKGYWVFVWDIYIKYVFVYFSEPMWYRYEHVWRSGLHRIKSRILKHKDVQNDVSWRVICVTLQPGGLHVCILQTPNLIW